MEKVVIVDEKNTKQFGFTKNQEVERVECPRHFKPRYTNEMWVFSTQRNEPVRLYIGEYTII